MIEWLQDPETTRAWFDPETTGTLIGAFGGAGVGVVFAALGTGMGIFAPRGKGRRFFLGSLIGMGLLGLALLIAGITAVSLGQPYGVWYPFLLIGGLSTGLGFGLAKSIDRVYQQTEQRRLQAESLRRG